jgi:superfamily II DNA or RNA helicase
MSQGNCAQNRPVEIVRSGNVLGVTPDMHELLGPILSYTHKEMINDWANGDGLRMQTRKVGLYRVADGTLYTLQGALSRIVRTLKINGINYTFTDKRKVTKLEPDYEHFKMCMPNVEYRYKQDEALAAMIAHNSGHIVAPTAYGKTFLMLALVSLYPKCNVIIASPTTTLLRGTYRRMLEITGDVGLVGDGKNDPQRVTLTTNNSLMRCNVERCDILMLDESHRTPGNEMSSNVSKMRNVVKILGLTASPSGRSDGADLKSEVLVGPVIFDMDYKEAAEHGLVSNIKVVMVPMMAHQIDTITCSNPTMRKRWYYWNNDDRNRRLAEAVQHYPESMGMRSDPQILILVDTVAHAMRLQRYLPDFTVVYKTMSRAREDELRESGLIDDNFVKLTAKVRNQIQRDFEDGKARRVIATGTWGEGVDFVHLDVVVNASGTGSDINMIQWSGRNSRLYEGKEFGLLIDAGDQWQAWTRRRACARRKMYKSKGWEVIEPKAGYRTLDGNGNKNWMKGDDNG